MISTISTRLSTPTTGILSLIILLLSSSLAMITILAGLSQLPTLFDKLSKFTIKEKLTFVSEAVSINFGQTDDKIARIVIIAKLEDSSSMIRDRMPVVGVDNLVLIVEIMSAGWN
jgi:hypothetical protein